jgi:hypothetical protein
VLKLDSSGSGEAYNKLLSLQADRRKQEERRASDEVQDQSQKQSDGERRQRDRRVLRFGLAYKTSRSLGGLMQWLDDTYEGGWTVVLCEIGGLFGKKSAKTMTVNIMFELEEDRMRLKQKLAVLEDSANPSRVVQFF